MRHSLLALALVMAAAAYGAPVSMECVDYTGWPNCVRLGNGAVEVIATTDVGPRLLRFGFVGEQNLLKEFDQFLGRTGGDEWCVYGGHRLWHAPEDSVRTYALDNGPVEHTWDGRTLRLIQAVESTTGIQKEIEVTLDADENRVTILHRMTNTNLWGVELAPWALTCMAQSGRAVFPQEPYRSHPEYLLPARPLVLWHYTDMADPRWQWGKKYILLDQDPEAKTKQKFGCRNAQGWMGYLLNGDLFVKRYACDPDGDYPDDGCNTECYTDAGMLELETLGPLTQLAPGESVEHVEEWYLFKTPADWSAASEAELDKGLPALLEKTRPVDAP